MGTKVLTVNVINPEHFQNAVMKYGRFIAGDQKSFRDMYFSLKQNDGIPTHYFFQLMSDDSEDNFHGIVYYNLDSLRDDAVAFNFFGGDK